VKKTRRLILPFVCLLLLLLELPANLIGQQADEALIRRYSQEAEKALAAKDAEAAAALLEKLSRLAPNIPEVFANLGVVYYTQNRYAQAAEAFQRALKLNPKIANVPLMLGMCYAGLDRPKEAIPILEPAFQQSPDKDIGRMIGIKLMDAYSSVDEHIKALQMCEELLQRYPDDPEMLYRASHMHGDRALQTMSRLVKVAPESPWKRMAFAEALEAEKRFDLAVMEYRKVIEADPNMPGAHYRLGRALLLRSLDSDAARDEAIGEFQKALATDSRNAGADYELGEIFRRRGQADQAITHFAQAVQIDPGFKEAQIAFARTLLQLHKPKEALAPLHAAIQLDPTNEVSHFLLAQAYKSLGDRASYNNEMAVYQKYHLVPYAKESMREEPLPAALSTPEVTRQTLEPENPPQP